MKLIIAGSRDIINYNILLEGIKKYDLDPDVILSGGARGADALGERYAKENKLGLECYPAQWDKYGRGAGFKRNVAMAKNGDVLLALWDGKSKGTAHMIVTAKLQDLNVYIIECKPQLKRGRGINVLCE